MFKLLKFVDEYKTAVYEVSEFKIADFFKAVKVLLFEWKFSQNVSIFSSLLLVVTKIATTLYYCIDNLNWIFNVGVVSKNNVDRKFWKKWKAILNLIRNWTQFVRSIILCRQVYIRQTELAKELSFYDDEVIGPGCFKATELLRKYIN